MLTGAYVFSFCRGLAPTPDGTGGAPRGSVGTTTNHVDRCRNKVTARTLTHNFDSQLINHRMHSRALSATPVETVSKSSDGSM